MKPWHWIAVLLLPGGCLLLAAALWNRRREPAVSDRLPRLRRLLNASHG